MPRKAKDATQGLPATGAAVQPADGVRPQVKQMSGHANEEEMIASLPTNTMTTAPDSAPGTGETPKRTRRSKAEMAEARGLKPSTVPVEDPNMADPIYRRHIERMRSKTGGGIVTGGFKLASKVMDDPKIVLSEDEEGDVKGCFYVASKKFGWGLDPASSPWTMAFYLFGLIGTFVFQRVATTQADKWTENFKRMIFGEDADKPEDHEEKKGDS